MDISEDGLQTKWFTWAHNTYPELRDLLFHVPNGGFRNKAEATKMKGMGVRRGIPDLILVFMGTLIAFELKVGKNDLSDDQVRIHKKWRAQGFTVHTFWEDDFEQFARIITSIAGRVRAFLLDWELVPECNL